MKLKTILNNLEEVDEGHRSFYTQRPDGKYTLDLDGAPPGMVPGSKVDEFRDNNIKLLKEQEELREALKEAQDRASKLSDLEQKLQEEQEKKMIDAGKIEEVVEEKLARRTDGMRRELEGKISAKDMLIDSLSAEAKTASKSYEDLLIDSEITKAASTVGSIRRGAIMDVHHRARDIFKVKEGRIVAMDGEQMLYGKDANTLLSPSEWMTSLSETAPHLFEPSRGGGSKGGDQRDTHMNVDRKTVQTGDASAFGANLEAIAKGEVAVV